MNYIIIHSNKNLNFAKNKWHFIIRKNGEIQKLLSVSKTVFHCMGKNKNTISICFEGEFYKESKMPYIQLKTGQNLINKLKIKYPKIKIMPHRAFMPVNCPGDYFPFNKLVNKNYKSKVVDIF